MKLTSDDVIRLARQARVRLSHEEVERFRTQLNAILMQMDVLNELSDAPDVAARDGDTGVRLREDLVGPDLLGLPIEKLTSDLVAGFFTVPRIVRETGSAR